MRYAHAHLPSGTAIVLGMRGVSFCLRLGPVGNQFAQTCLQLQLGAEQTLWWQCLASWQGFAGLCLGCFMLEEAPERGEELG